MAIEVTTGLDSSQEALMHSPQVNTVWAGQDTVPVHHHIRKSGATLHKNLIIYKYTGRMKTAQRDKREQEWEQGRGMVGEGDEEKKCGGGREKKKPSHPSVPADRQWRFSLSVSLGRGSGALQRLWPT